MSAAAVFPESTRLVRVSEVAKQLSLSRSMVYTMMDRGDLPYCKIGKSRRVPLDAVEKLVRDTTVSDDTNRRATAQKRTGAAG